MRDLFLLTKDVDIATYANDNTPYIVGDDIDHVISALQNATASLFEWFLDNQMKTTNPKKCYLLTDEICQKLTGNIISNSKCEKILGKKIDSKLSFETDVEDLCKKACQKTHELAKITPYKDLLSKITFLILFSKRILATAF